MNIKVLGTGCKACKKLHKEVENVIKEESINAQVEYISDLQEVMNYGVMNVPALVINDKVVSSGKALSKKEIIEVISGEKEVHETPSCDCGGNC